MPIHVKRLHGDSFGMVRNIQSIDFFGGDFRDQLYIIAVQFPVICCIWSIRSIDCHQNAFFVAFALKNKLVICDDYISVAAVS